MQHVYAGNERNIGRLRAAAGSEQRRRVCPDRNALLLLLLLLLNTLLLLDLVDGLLLRAFADAEHSIAHDPPQLGAQLFVDAGRRAVPVGAR